ncbi:thiol-disulfide oxidoreductase DCC family protein [Texcoconibacillus texcoconensis]|uniref:Putative DCC family thiol-disulfide oxidoreductase YuxK n=1 Tax=Texcoconibacillus texcoconensis TaxID=1095777 RepID=A0A840QH38_9BACI|nr:thiol-disulfide oxidoreductase DCC family protein [Texcoconibacillus texcoconensis]MBB5171972.1 putative DCC family thiol-disulfide oxidoreductase YuxK [Texcoconibacillus texcoconensis]
MSNKIILFDGECHFCDRSVHFIFKRDKKAVFKFASLQSDIGQELLRTYHAPAHIDSLVLIDDKHCYIKSSAALHICKHLSGLWKLFYGLFIIPRPVRDFVYEMIAKNRYRWFGKKEQCSVPSPEVRKRFLSSDKSYQQRRRQ